MPEKVKFAVVYPWETRAPINMTPGGFAKRAEDLGFDSVFIRDSVAPLKLSHCRQVV